MVASEDVLKAARRNACKDSMLMTLILILILVTHSSTPILDA